MTSDKHSKLKRLAQSFGALFLLGTLVAAVMPSQANACGGFFCSQAAPINQTAERILFSKNDDGTVTTVVEILYQGDADKFAWVLPVPGTPDVAASSTAVFDQLQRVTNPSYRLNRSSSCDFSGTTTGGTTTGGAFGTGGATGTTTGTTTGGGPTVSVVDAGTVGSLEFETISIDAADQDPADVAIRWLDDNEYDTGTLGADVLRPYLANGLNLIAFKLQAGASTGSIRPISLTYESTTPIIPIVPTSVAASDDMGVMVWVLGSDRAIPTNYKTLELNEMLIDWFTNGSNYNEVVTAAADEAGGQGFVTENALPLDAAFRSSIDTATGTQGFVDFNRGQQHRLLPVLESLTFQFGGAEGYLEAVRETVPLKEGATAETFISCPVCYTDEVSSTDPILTTDLDQFLNAIEDNVIKPMTDTLELFDNQQYVTRLYTTMSAGDMTLDPEFDFNPDAEDVDNLHQADMVTDCNGDWEVTLADGRKLVGESGNQVWAPLDDTDRPFNIRVLQFGTTGLPDVITDNTEEAMARNPTGEMGGGMDGSTSGGTTTGEPATGGMDEGSSDPSAPKSGGGCSVSTSDPPPSNFWFLLGASLIGFGAFRRVRKHLS